MGQAHHYTEYHPQWLRRRMSTYWWMEKPAYLRFILREGSCLFVGWFTVYLLLLFRAVALGAEPYQQFMAWSATPIVMLLNVLSFVFLVFHAITFFEAAPQAMVVRLGENRVPGRLVLLGHYGAWLVASAVVCWLVGV